MGSIRGQGRLGALLAGVCMLALATAAVGFAADAPVCVEYKPKNQIHSLGQRPFALKVPVQDVAGLQAMFVAQGDEIRGILEANGLGEIADALAGAVAAGQVEERTLERGEALNWMVYRPSRRGPAKLIAPACYAGKRAYPAFVVAVEVKEEPVNPDAICALEVTGDPEAKTVRASSAGSSAGATVTMKGPDGEQVVMPAGASEWQGPWVKRYCADYEFVVAAPAPQVERKVRRYDFVIPKACGNLAFAGESHRMETITGNPCTKSVELARIEPPAPSIDVAVGPDYIRRGETARYEAKGYWDREGECGIVDPLVVTAKGPKLDARFTEETGEVVMPRMGVYDFEGTAKNAVGASATDAVQVRVHPLWTVRGFLSHWDPESDWHFAQRRRANGSSEREHFRFENGWGLGLAAEYHINELFGFEGALNWGKIDTGYRYGLDNQLDSSDDTVTALTLSVGPNFHFFRRDRLNLYFGPFLAWTTMGESEFTALGSTLTRRSTDEFGLGAQLGLDIPFGVMHPWGFHAGLRYIHYEPDLLRTFEGIEVDPNPLLAVFGLRYSF